MGIIPDQPIINKAPNLLGFYKTIGGGAILFIVFLTIYLCVYTVHFVPNQYEVNKTVEDKVITTVEQHYYINSEVPVNVFGKNSQKHFGIIEVFVVVASVIIYTYLIKKRELSGLKTLDQAKECIYNRLKSIHEVKDFIILPQSHLQVIRINEEQPSPYKFHIFTETLYEGIGTESGHRYEEYILDPYTLLVYKIVKLETYPNAQTICPNCGASPDFRRETPEHLKEMAGFVNSLKGKGNQ